MNQLDAIRFGVLAIVLIYIIYIWFNWRTTALVETTSLNLTNPAITITNSPSSINYSYSLWMYVNSWSATPKPIFSRMSDSGTTPQIELSLGASSPTLTVSIGTGTATSTSVTITSNFPLQRWTFVSINVASNSIDVYLDGKLVSSNVLTGAIQPSSVTGVCLGGASFTKNDIFISNLERAPTMLGPMDVWNKYIYGNGNWWTYLGLSKYNATLTIKRDGQETATTSLF